MASSTQEKRTAKKGKKAHHVDARLISLIKASKATFWRWKQDCNSGENAFASYETMRLQKKQLRSMQRQLTAEKRKQHLGEIIEASPVNQALLYKLIRGQRKHDRNTQVVFDSIPLTGPELSETWSLYLKLAIPSEHPEFNAEHKDRLTMCNMILEAHFEKNRNVTHCAPLTKSHIYDIIKDLKNNKAPDRWGISGEHLKNADTTLLQVLIQLVNTIQISRCIPVDMKCGVITPIYKGKGDKNNPDCYRRITATSALGKLVEKVLVIPTKEILQPNLNRQQRGFCVGAFSINTALLVT